MMRSLVFLLCWLLAITTGLAQNSSAINIPSGPGNLKSPNAASFGLYGEVPISYYSGVPQIDIPLGEVREGKIQVPISLSYHASGFRPDVHPGWVGQGWNLNVGGVISRTMKDDVDEAKFPSTSSAADVMGFYYNGWRLGGGDWNVTRPDMYQIVQDGAKKDYEPDEFSFNFLGYSGKFYIDAAASTQTNTVWRVKSDRHLTVTLDPVTPFLKVPFSIPSAAAGQSLMQDRYAMLRFGGFVITTDDGTRYHFGGSTDAIEYSIDMFDQNAQCWSPDSWYLTKILHSDGSQVIFKYSPNANTFVTQLYISAGTKGYTYNTTYCSPPGNTLWTNLEGNVGGQLVRPVYLDAIQTATTTVTFTRRPSVELRYDQKFYGFYANNTFIQRYCASGSGCGGIAPYPFLMGPFYFGGQASENSPADQYPQCLNKLQWYQLDEIAFNTNGKKHGFAFKYSAETSKRLTLEQVIEKELPETAGTLKKPPYIFSYNIDYASFGSLPPYLNNTTDHWGFYNAVDAPIIDPAETTNNPALFSTYKFNPNYYAYREPAKSNPNVTLLGMLRQIKYPTGGVTDFTFEQHSYSAQVQYGGEMSTEPFLAAAVSSRELAGGVRIRKISSYTLAKAEQKVEREYFYVKDYDNTKNTTALASSGILGQRAQYYFDNECGTGSNGAKYCLNAFSTQSVLPASGNSAGSHIGYSQVVEKRSDGSFTRFHFTNYDQVRDESPLAALGIATQTGYSPFSSNAEQRGKLRGEEQFNKDNQRVKTTTISYVNFDKARSYVRAAKGINFGVCGGGNFAQGVAYKFYTYSTLPEYKEETVYDLSGNNGITSSTLTQYNEDQLPASIVARTSTGTIETVYKYPRDYTYPALPISNPVTGAMADMVRLNMVSYLVETRVLRNNQVIDASIQTYKQFGVGIQPYQVFRLETTQPLPVAGFAGLQFSGAGSPPSIGLPLKLTFTGYNSRSNPLGVVKEGGQKSSYFWGYSNNLLVAQAENATSDEVFYSNFEEGTGWDTSLRGYSDIQVRTGRTAGYLSNYAGPTPEGVTNSSFSTTPLTVALSAPRKYLLSGWVYSAGPQAQLSLFMYGPGGTREEKVTTTKINQWVYLEKEITVPADVVTINVRLGNHYSASSPFNGRIWFDDIRVHPADAQMTTYTHAPTIGVTSISDASNKPAVYEYDGLNRLSIVRDHQGNIVKQYQYRYKQ